MAYTGKKILRDYEGSPIPQIWDEFNSKWLPADGKSRIEDTVLDTRLADISVQIQSLKNSTLSIDFTDNIIVLEKEEVGVEIPIESSIERSFVIDGSYKKIFASVNTDITHDFDIEVLGYISGKSIGRQLLINSGDDGVGFCANTPHIEVVSDEVRIRISNNSTDTFKTYFYYIGGVK